MPEWAEPALAPPGYTPALSVEKYSGTGFINFNCKLDEILSPPYHPSLPLQTRFLPPSHLSLFIKTKSKIKKKRENG